MTIMRKPYPFDTFQLMYDVRAEKRPHKWLGGVLGVVDWVPQPAHHRLTEMC